MPRPSLQERARAYVAVMPLALMGSGGDKATYEVAVALVKGFDLGIDGARPLLQEYNTGCKPPWTDSELEHKLSQAAKDQREPGFLAKVNGDYVKEEFTGTSADRSVRVTKQPKPEYDPEELIRFAGPWAKTVDLLWLANRSAVDPATMGTAEFLRGLYGEEKVLMFNECNLEGKQITQGEAMWPHDAPLHAGKYGVWFLPQPVDGLYHPNPDRTDKEGQPKMSRRSKESVVNFRYLVLESDDAPAREWLGALVQWPLRIAAIYTSGSRSVHALVRLDARTKSEWDDKKKEMAPSIDFMLRNGLDPGVLSAVRLSRLPQAWRCGKVAEANGRTLYQKFERPQLQKLLYFNAEPEAIRLIDCLPRRDIETVWCKNAATGVSDADETGGRWLLTGLRYYARQSARIREALQALQHSP